MIRLGVVGANGAVYFSHHNINEVRRFLKGHGLEVTYTGWQSESRYGAIYYVDGVWLGAYWDKASAIKFEEA